MSVVSSKQDLTIRPRKKRIRTGLFAGLVVSLLIWIHLTLAVVAILH
jgi:hypothetical protein